MAKFTYAIELDDSSGYAWEEAYLRVKVSRVDAEATKVHVATYEMRWPENDACDQGDGCHMMTCATKFFSQSEARGTYDLELMALTMKAIGDAFTEDHELYDQVFADADGEPRDLHIEIDNGR